MWLTEKSRDSKSLQAKVLVKVTYFHVRMLFRFHIYNHTFKREYSENETPTKSAWLHCIFCSFERQKDKSRSPLLAFELTSLNLQSYGGILLGVNSWNISVIKCRFENWWQGISQSAIWVTNSSDDVDMSRCRGSSTDRSEPWSRQKMTPSVSVWPWLKLHCGLGVSEWFIKLLERCKNVVMSSISS